MPLRKLPLRNRRQRKPPRLRRHNLRHKPPSTRCQTTRGRGWRSTASPCSTTATSSRWRTRSGSTCSGQQSCQRLKASSGRDGHWFAGVRQSRLGVRSFTPTDLGELRTSSSSSCSARRRRGANNLPTAPCVGRARKMGRRADMEPLHGSTSSPNSIEYWGRTGWCFSETCSFGGCRGRRTTLTSGWRSSARERAPIEPNFADRIELENVLGRFPAPDLSARYLHADDWGHVQLAGLLRYMTWDDLLEDDPFDLNGHDWGWGVNLSSNIKVGKHVAKRRLSMARA